MGVAEIFSRFSDSGLFTHAYCARGELGRDFPDFEFECSPDGRSVFDLASLTKALVTTPLVFYLADKIQKPLSATVGEWLSGFDHKLDPKLCSIRIEDLLAHMSGLPAWRNLWVCQLGVMPDPTLALVEHRHQLIVERLNRTVSSLTSPGSDVYSDVGFILLGYIIEVLEAADLAQVFRDFRKKIITGGVNELVFGCDLQYKSEVIPTAFCAVRQRHLVGEVHDENCAALGGIAGHAGLFGSGRGLAGYLNALTASAIGQQLLQANAVRRKLPVTDPPNASLLGWRQGADPSSRPFGDGAAMGHMGFTGVAFWVWPERHHYVILLTNRVISGRQTPGIAQMRREVFTELAAM